MTDPDQTTYLVRLQNHSKIVVPVIQDLVEKCSLVDIVVSCKTMSMNLHKCILAANSPYLRSKLEQNSDIKQIIIENMEVKIFQKMIEYIYSGIVNLSESQFEPFIVALKFFQLQGTRDLMEQGKSLPYRGRMKLPLVRFSIQKPKFYTSDMTYPPDVTASQPEVCCSEDVVRSFQPEDLPSSPVADYDDNSFDSSDAFTEGSETDSVDIEDFSDEEHLQSRSLLVSILKKNS